jgi:hypothetical protein
MDTSVLCLLSSLLITDEIVDVLSEHNHFWHCEQVVGFTSFLVSI